MSSVFKFGEEVEGYAIPVLNERVIRAAAGMLFLMMFISILEVLYRGNFAWLKYSVVIFLTDILIRVLINPRFAPSLIIGRWIVRNQTPEYVGAKQKLFAWVIGVVLALTMFILLVVVNTYSPITGIICLICLIFLFFEAAFGICLGCKVYPWFNKGKVQYCPGEVCEIKDRQAIQQTTGVQLLIVVVFAAYTFLVISSMKEKFHQPPHALFGEEIHQQSR